MPVRSRGPSEIRELEARSPYEHPGPRQTERDDEQAPVGERLAHQATAGHRRAKARRLEIRVLPEEAGLLRVEPEEVDPEGGYEQEQRDDVRAEELTPASIEAERSPAEIRVRDQESLLSRLEERIVERERERAQDRREHEEPHERPHLAAEREADPSPRGATQAITPRADHRDRNEQEHQERGEDLRHDVNRSVAGEARRQAQCRDRQTDEEQGFDEAEQQFLPGAVIREAIALEAGLTQQEAAHLDPTPEPVDAEGRERHQDVHDVDAEERAARAVEA
jgi:hypothetical protein